MADHHATHPATNGVAASGAAEPTPTPSEVQVGHLAPTDAARRLFAAIDDVADQLRRDRAVVARDLADIDYALRVLSSARRRLAIDESLEG